MWSMVITTPYHVARVIRLVIHVPTNASMQHHSLATIAEYYIQKSGGERERELD